MADSETPQAVESCPPWRHDQGNRLAAGFDRPDQSRVEALEFGGTVETQRGDERHRRLFKERLNSRCGTEELTGTAPAFHQRPRGLYVVPDPFRCNLRERRFEERLGHEVSMKSGKHG